MAAQRALSAADGSEVYSVGLYTSTDLANPVAVNDYVEGSDPRTRNFMLFYKGTAAVQTTYVVQIESAGAESFSDAG